MTRVAFAGAVVAAGALVAGGWGGWTLHAQPGSAQVDVTERLAVSS